MNERYGLKGGYIGLIEWIFNINRKQSFVTFAMRDMLTTSETYDQAVKYLAEVKLTAPCYYILAGPKSGQVRSHTFIFFHRYRHDLYYRVLLLLVHVMHQTILNHWGRIIYGF